MLPSALYVVESPPEAEQGSTLDHAYYLPEIEVLNDFVIYLETVFNSLFAVKGE